jgi:hypothetical protein
MATMHVRLPELIAVGNGVTIANAIQPNGFQPLEVFASAAFVRLASGDRPLALRIMFFLHRAILVLTARSIG